jgi:aspartate/glutamate racemase
MPDIVVFIHTISPLIGVFDQLASGFLHGVLVKHILDEPLLEGIRQRGGLTSSDSARLWDHLKMAESIRARVVLVTCSTLSPLLDNLRPLTTLPLVKINEAMIAAAVQAGDHLGVLVTNPTALAPTQMMFEAQARQSGREISYVYKLVDGAFSALLKGKADEHDHLVRQAVIELSARVDAVVLAQASMARVLAEIPEHERPVPIFSSPHLALEQVRKLLVDLGWG